MAWTPTTDERPKHRNELPAMGPMSCYAFNNRTVPFKIPEEFKPPPNWTDPKARHVAFVELFKGPDDANLIFKAKHAMRFALYVTAATSVYDICIGTQPKDVTGMVRRVGYWGIPFFGGGLAYLGTVAIVSSLRGGKSDQKNHFLGGLAFGAVVGACRKSIHFGCLTGIAAGIGGAFYKESILCDYEIFPDPRPMKTGGPFFHKHDYTMKWYRHQGKGDWVKSEEEREGYKTFLETVDLIDQEYSR